MKVKTGAYSVKSCIALIREPLHIQLFRLRRFGYAALGCKRKHQGSDASRSSSRICPVNS